MLVNIPAVFRSQAQRLGPRTALRFKRYGLWHDVSWQRYFDNAFAIAASMLEVGIRTGDRVALLGENSVPWLTCDLAILATGGVVVTPHAPLTARQLHFQLLDSGVVWAFVADAKQLEKIRSIRDELPDLRGVVVFDPALADPHAISLEAFLQHGRSARTRLEPELLSRERSLRADDLATILYTSGTTGNPKGVMLSHNNILSNARACELVQPHQPDDVVLGWLPHTHIYARTCDHYTSLVAGVALALSDSPETVIADLAEVQPTHLSAVPRFYEKVLAAVATPDPVQTAKRLKGLFGSRMDWISSGGAPLPVAIAQAFHAAGLQLMQGYGLTETAPVISFNTKKHNKLGTVGRALPGVEIKIADDGEILTRGPHVMLGYWRNPQATAEVIRDGWFHTGDLGQLDEEGYLSITGRKKEMMILSNGKKISPSNIEGLLLADACMDQVILCGEGRNFVTALIVPNWVNVRKHLQGIALPHDPVSAARDERVIALLQQRCEQALKEVSHLEQVRKFVVLPRPFSVEAEELTVSLKLRRNVILSKYASALDALYQE
jgi:long-chain acyl-CoA synthetase